MFNTSSKDVYAPLRLRIDATRQLLEVFRDGKVCKSYPVSTSRFGLGFEPGSNKTPLGWFAVRKKIGAGVDTGAGSGAVNPQGRSRFRAARKTSS